MNPLTVVGIDRRGNSFYAVRVTESTGRPEVHSVMCYNDDHCPDDFLSEHDRVVLSVPDDLVQVKPLCLNRSDPIDIRARARFELARSLLEPENEFLFDVLINDEGDLHAHLNVLVNGRDIRFLDGNLDTLLVDGDQVSHFQALSGGQKGIILLHWLNQESLCGYL